MFFNRPKNHLSFALILFTLVACCELLTYWSPFYGKLGVVSYLVLFIPLMIWGFKNLRQIIHLSFKHHTYFSLSVVIALVVLLIVNIFLPQNIGGESTQEINCTLNHLLNSADKGYHQTCLFGYPAKQYFLPSLLSLFFGRTKFNLHFGNSIYFLIALPIFIEGLRSFTHKKWVESDLLIAITLVFSLHFFYFNHFLFRLFEQSVYPFCLLLLLLGLFLQFKKEQTDHLLVLIGFVVALSIFAYTPGLAIASLAILVMGVGLVVRPIKNKKLLGYILFLLLMMLVSSFIYRKDVHLLTNEEKDLFFYVDQLQKIVEHFLFANQGRAFMSVLVSPILVIVWLVSAFQTKHKLLLVLSWWLAVTTFLATIAQGYAFYGFDFRMHRALVVAPAWLLLFFSVLQKINFPKKFLLFVFGFYFLTGLHYQRLYIQSEADNKHWLLIEWLTRFLPVETSGKITLTEKALEFYLSLNDELQYFYPGLRTEVALNDFGKNCQFETEYLLMDENDFCRQSLLQNPAVNLLAVYQLPPDRRLKLKNASGINFYLLSKKSL